MSIPAKKQAELETAVTAEILEARRVEAAAAAARQIELEAAILDELRRMNRLLYGITYGPKRFTLSFFSGITRGLGAVLGATVVFALFAGALSYLDTTPVIGNYVKRILVIAQPAGNGHSNAVAREPAQEPVKQTPKAPSGNPSADPATEPPSAPPLPPSAP